jgi:hypothetical protein
VDWRCFSRHGPIEHPRYQLLVRDLRRFAELDRSPDAEIRAVLDRAGAHFLTADGSPRRSGAIPPYKGERDYPSADVARLHRTAVFQVAPQVERVLSIFTRDLNVVLARGIRQMFAIALSNMQTLDGRSVWTSPMSSTRVDAAPAMDEFSGTASGSNRGITTCSSTNSGYEPCPMGAGVL